jgi:hypothetical protein
MSDIPDLLVGDYSIYLDEFVEEIRLNGLINSMLRWGVSMMEISDDANYQFLLQNLEDVDMEFFLVTVVEKFRQTGEIPNCLDFRS